MTAGERRGGRGDLELEKGGTQLRRGGGSAQEEGGYSTGGALDRGYPAPERGAREISHTQGGAENFHYMGGGGGDVSTAS